MLGSQKLSTKIAIVSTFLCLSGCIAPLIMGGAAATAMVATKEKGIGGTMSDSNICTKVKMNLYNFSPDLHAKVSVSVQNKEVLLTGTVQDPSWPQEAERLAKSVEGVKEVINHIETEGEETLGSMSSDSWITTRIKSKLLFETDLYSLNYTIETSNGTVYLTGIGQSEEEINRVVEIARNVGGVKKVVNHVKVKGQEGAEESSAASASPEENTPAATESMHVGDAPIDQSSTIPEEEPTD
ncbi:MAG: BON domain-containing protein [Pseudomonadota bacterium]|jgi:osmotically-inducible protein OsmY|nr:BON domain-containing protein [Alphaproteobacteria bacterium]